MREKTDILAGEKKEMKAVRRGFPRSEFEKRFEWIRQRMSRQDLEAIVLTSPNEIYYYTGLETQFFASPSRPYYLILTPRRDTPIAVFPEIMGAPVLDTTWVETCRTFSVIHNTRMTRIHIHE